MHATWPASRLLSSPLESFPGHTEHSLVATDTCCSHLSCHQINSVTNLLGGGTIFISFTIVVTLNGRAGSSTRTNNFLMWVTVGTHWAPTNTNCVWMLHFAFSSPKDASRAWHGTLIFYKCLLFANLKSYATLIIYCRHKFHSFSFIHLL